MTSSESKGAKKIYSRKDIEEARQKMLSHLASISGGTLIMGCCTQGCCEKDAQEWVIRWPDRQ